MEPRAQRLVLPRTPGRPVRRRSARYGAGGDIAAQCPYLNLVPVDGKVPSGMGGRMGKCSLMFAYVRLCSLNWKKMFGVGVGDQPQTRSNRIRPNPPQ